MNEDNRTFGYSIGIFVAGIVAALICFGVLDSTAEWSTGYNASGAIVGALVTMFALVTIKSRLVKQSFGRQADIAAHNARLMESQRQIEEIQRDSQARIDELGQQNEDLRTKVLLGFSPPTNFEPEVDERNRIVLARPKGWLPLGNAIFRYQGPAKSLKPDDVFPAQFSVMVEPFEASELKGSDADYYDVQGENLHRMVGPDALTSEIIMIGGDPGQPSLKAVFQAYARVQIRHDVTGPQHTVNVISRDEYEKELFDVADEVIQRSARVAALNLQLSDDGGLAGMLDKSKDRTSVASRIHAALLAGEIYTADEVLAFKDVDGKWHLTSPEEIKSFEGSGERDLRGASSTGDAKEGAVAPGGSTGSEGAGKAGASSLEGVETLQIDGWTVVPMWRMLLICRHRTLKKVFVMDFMDDVRDFTKSSQTFNQVVNSIRFLV